MHAHGQDAEEGGSGAFEADGAAGGADDGVEFVAPALEDLKGAGFAGEGEDFGEGVVDVGEGVWGGGGGVEEVVFLVEGGGPGHFGDGGGEEVAVGEVGAGEEEVVEGGFEGGSSVVAGGGGGVGEAEGGGSWINL